MSDEHLRELERRWRQTLAPEDEAAYILERERMGQFSHLCGNVTLAGQILIHRLLCAGITPEDWQNLQNNMPWMGEAILEAIRSWRCTAIAPAGHELVAPEVASAPPSSAGDDDPAPPIYGEVDAWEPY